MIKGYIYAVFISFFVSLLLSIVGIPILKKIKAGQTILSYVKEHREKNGTPTMGGIFFVLSTCITFLLLGGAQSKVALSCLSIGFAYMIVGFIDDFLKIKYSKNEGLKPYQKIIFQLGVSLIAGWSVYTNGLTQFAIPFTRSSVDLGVFTIFLVSFVFIALTNSVNLTDGLDGLAGGVSVAYAIGVSVIIILQTGVHGLTNSKIQDQTSLLVLSFALIGAITAYLIFNVSKARVFMGDTGSLALGGFLGGISVYSGNSFFIPLIGITFVASSISVIIQVLYYKATKKRVFLMAPIHHHFQHKGYSETQISFVYFVITCFFGMACILSYA